MIDSPSNENMKQEQKERIEAYAERLAGHASILSEKEYQHFIMERLSKDNGYVIRKAVKYDRLFAVDREMLFKFLNATQPDEMAALPHPQRPFPAGRLLPSTELCGIWRKCKFRAILPLSPCPCLLPKLRRRRPSRHRSWEMFQGSVALGQGLSADRARLEAPRKAVSRCSPRYDIE